MSELSRRERNRALAKQSAMPAFEPVPRHAKLSKRNPAGTIVGFVAAALSVLLVSTAAVGSVVWNSFSRPLAANAIVLDDTPPPPPNIGAIDGGFNMLLVGSDSRVGQGGLGGEDEGARLNDVNILIHVAQDQQSAVVVSFPRDLEVELPECARWFGYVNKLNTAYYENGLPCVVETIENLTGVDIPYAAVVEFRGVVNLSDAIGGVDVCIDGPIDDPDSGAYFPEAGTYTLQGEQALAFLRTRKGVGDGSDLGRISSQQVFLSSLVRKIKSEDTLGNPGRVFALAQAAVDNLQLSSGLADPYSLAQLALAVKDIPLDRVTFVQYPTYYTGNGNVAPVQWAADELFSYIIADQPFVLSAVGDDRASVPDPNAPPPDPATQPEVDNSGLPVAQGVTGQTAADYTCSVSNY